jgi:N-acetylglucosaminyldiphosphoundecaprenol N-acetyl-beta-D-mannosaminyltransferase
MIIFGVDIQDVGKEEILRKIDGFLREPKFHQIATVNPEFLLEAEHNEEFRDVLDGCDLRIVDGFGVVLAGWIRGVRLHRYPGADLVLDLLAKAERDGLGVFFAVRKDGLSSFDDVSRAVKSKYPELIFSGNEFAIDDKRLTIDYDRESYSEIINHASKIVLCNFGAPHQELFLSKMKGTETTVRLGMGVGGTLDFLTDRRKRAPRWMRALGLEWFWRFVLQPKRFARIWNATVVFLWKVFCK